MAQVDPGCDLAAYDASGARRAVRVVGGEDTANQTRVYRVDAAALSPKKRAAKPTPELERETHDILGRTVDDLKDHTFQIVRIDPAVADDGSVMHYDVTVHPQVTE